MGLTLSEQKLTLSEQKTRVGALAPSPVGRHLNPLDPYPE